MAGIELAKHLGHLAERDAEQVTKGAKALESGLSVAEIVTPFGSNRASVKRYRHELLVVK